MGSEKKQILIVTSEFPPQPGGIGNHAYNLALYLSKQHYNVNVIADQRSQKGKAEVDFDKGLPFNVFRIKRYSFRPRMYVKRIIITCKNFRNASSIIATGKFSLWNVGFLSVFFKQKTIAIIHGTEVNFKPYLLRKSIDYSLKQFDIIVAVSNYTKNLIQHLNIDIEVIPNGIELKNWKIEKSTNIELKGNPSLTTVGRVSTRKGQLNVINHLPALIKDFPKLHYHCIGIPTEADVFVLKAKKLGVQNHITFHGSVDDSFLKEKLSKTDIFVMLSSESKSGDVEGFGIAILEANAFGVPAIGSKGCGIEDAINPNLSGFLIDFNNTQQLKNSIENISDNKEVFEKGSRDWAKQHDWSKIIKRYIDIIE